MSILTSLFVYAAIWCALSVITATVLCAWISRKKKQ